VDSGLTNAPLLVFLHKSDSEMMPCATTAWFSAEASAKNAKFRVAEVVPGAIRQRSTTSEVFELPLDSFQVPPDDNVVRLEMS